MNKDKIEIGDEVKDTVTGFKGIAVGQVIWLHGCVRYIVQPVGVDDKGKPFDNQSFDVGQLAVIEKAKVKRTLPIIEVEQPAARTGGPMPVPSRGGEFNQ